LPSLRTAALLDSVERFAGRVYEQRPVARLPQFQRE
jgi:hypothetical protein